MSGRPPYFPCYPRDFTSDGKVEAMNTTEVGAYWLLLCKAWFEDPAGSIPNDDSVLARWARMDAAAWAGCRTAVLSAFVLGTDGRWHQKRMRQVYAELMVTLKARSAGGKKGAAKRWGKEEMGEPSLSHSSPNAKPLPSGFVFGSGFPGKEEGAEEEGGAGEGEAGKRKTQPRAERTRERFAEFWAAYPKKVSKRKALEQWKQLAPDDELAGVILAAVEAQKRQRAAFAAAGQWHADWKDPEHWLRVRRWEDDPLTPVTVNGRAAPPGLTDAQVETWRREAEARKAWDAEAADPAALKEAIRRLKAPSSG